MTNDQSTTCAASREHHKSNGEPPSGGVDLVHTERMPPAAQRTGVCNLVFVERAAVREHLRNERAIAKRNCASS